MTSEQKPKEAYKEYWIEGNEIAPFVYLASTKYFPDTPGCKIIHVIEYSAYEQLQQENAKLKEQRKVAVEALKFYSLSSNYIVCDEGRNYSVECVAYELNEKTYGDDKLGTRAKEALNKIESAGE